jgi:hypothetical protein
MVYEPGEWWSSRFVEHIAYAVRAAEIIVTR